MTQLFHMCLEDDNLACWMERVPSEANLADLPSRGQVKEAADIINGRAVDDMDSDQTLVSRIIENCFLDDSQILFEANQTIFTPDSCIQISQSKKGALFPSDMFSCSCTCSASVGNRFPLIGVA